MSVDVSRIVRRVVRRVLEERGGAPPAPGDRTLITAACIARIPDGGSLRVPPGAWITPLAREEAWRRRIALEGEDAQGGWR